MDAVQTTLRTHEAAIARHETLIQKHEVILTGVDDCEDTGLVTQVRELSKAVKQLAEISTIQRTYNKIMVFFAAAVGSAAVALIWDILTHAVTLVKP